MLIGGWIRDAYNMAGCHGDTVANWQLITTYHQQHVFMDADGRQMIIDCACDRYTIVSHPHAYIAFAGEPVLVPRPVGWCGLTELRNLCSCIYVIAAVSTLMPRRYRPANLPRGHVCVWLSPVDRAAIDMRIVDITAHVHVRAKHWRVVGVGRLRPCPSSLVMVSVLIPGRVRIWIRKFGTVEFRDINRITITHHNNIMLNDRWVIDNGALYPRTYEGLGEDVAILRRTRAYTRHRMRNK